MWGFLKREKEIKEIVQLEIVKMISKIGFDFKFAQHMQKLEVGDGDIIVCRYPGVLSEVAHERLKKDIEEVIKNMGTNVKVIILEDGLDMSVLKKERPTKDDLGKA